jgi:hypothetical protein
MAGVLGRSLKGARAPERNPAILTPLQTNASERARERQRADDPPRTSVSLFGRRRRMGR